MDAITIFPENEGRERTLKAMLKMMQLHFERSRQIALERKRMKKMQERLEELEDILDMMEVEKRTKEPNIPAEQVYAEIEKNGNR